MNELSVCKTFEHIDSMRLSKLERWRSRDFLLNLFDHLTIYIFISIKLEKYKNNICFSNYFAKQFEDFNSRKYSSFWEKTQYQI